MLRRLLRIQWYRTKFAVRSFKWWTSHMLVLGVWVLFGWPVYKQSILQGIAHTALALILVYGRARRGAASSNLQLVEHGYLERKVGLYHLLHQLQYTRASMNEAQRAAFQRSTLDLIASYVRAHRADWDGTEIFVNLLVPDGDDLLVVARSTAHRVPGARYPKEAMFAWQAIQSGEATFCGDLHDAAPHSRHKPYKSILALPIHGDQEILGAVSIDSTQIYHFDGETDRLTRYLLPYVCLLGWTLLDSRPNIDASDIIPYGEVEREQRPAI